MVVGAVSVTACARSEITAPDAPSVGQFTVDASTGWAYVDLSTGALVPQTSASTSSNWDIGFNATSVALNGGTSGPAGVTGICLCQNAAATNDQVLQMTPDNQEAAFTAISVGSVPGTSAAWSSDVFAVSKWYRYDILGDHVISPTYDIYFVKRGTAVYKIQITGYYGPAGEVRQITARYSKVLN
jgi:hypothetical protein